MKLLSAFLQEHKTSFSTEARAATATFLTMGYILFVNPQILANAGMPVEASIAATAVAAALSTIVMGLYSNLPVAMAPGMGLNALFAFTLCGALGLSWQVALGVVFIEGMLNVILAYTRFRDWIVDAIPEPLKLAIAVGIGFFLALIGAKQMGIVVANPATLVTRGSLGALPTLLGLGGLALTGILFVRNFIGSDNHRYHCYFCGWIYYRSRTASYKHICCSSRYSSCALRLRLAWSSLAGARRSNTFIHVR